VTRHDFLREVHRAYRPRSYLEIGVNLGRSLALSRTRTIAVDPAFKVTEEVECDLRLVRATSDEFFAREDGLAHLPDGLVDLAFIDGLHLFEAVLRDFANVERHAHWASVIVLDDVLPRSAGEASRDRAGRKAWAGDVYKLTEVLVDHRPDLLVLPLDVEPTGVLVVLGADPESHVLAERYDAIVAELAAPDPQPVPGAVLRRQTAFDPASLPAALWEELRNARDAGRAREDGWAEIRASFEAAARPAEPRAPAPDSPPRRRRSLRRRLRL
jgi:hypothetical protein